MNSRISLIAVVIIGGLTLACGTGKDVATAPTAVDGNTSTRGPLPPPVPPPSGSCDAARAQFAVGEPASRELLERARVAAGADVARFIRPDEAITLEFSPARLNLNLNHKDVVHSVYCG